MSNEQNLKRYRTDGICEIDNNPVENSIRPFTIGKKNWLFCDTPKRAQASAAAYSILETCVTNGIDPENISTMCLQGSLRKSGLSVRLHWRNIFPGLRRSRRNVNEKSHRIWTISHTRWDFNRHRLFTAYVNPPMHRMS